MEPQPTVARARLLVIEPYYGGSHAQLVEYVRRLHGPADAPGVPPCVVLTLPAKKWAWRLRAGALWAAAAVPESVASWPSGTLLCSSMLNLAELLALRPDVRHLRTVLYFHENQLAFPTRSGAPEGGARSAVGAPDFNLGWAQIASALAADVVAFNSEWCLRSFVSAVDAHLRAVPDGRQRVPGVADAIARKAVVAHFPVARPPPPEALGAPAAPGAAAPLRIAWPHRWEYDKAPAAFFAALAWLHGKRVPFAVAVLGEAFAESPPEFAAARAWLEPAGLVAQWGFAPSRADYFAWLRWADVVVSTADHEFFGVSTVEAIGAGCFPLLPARLSYPELVAPTAAERAAGDPVAAAARVRALRAGVGGRAGLRGAMDGGGVAATATDDGSGDGEVAAEPQCVPAPPAPAAAGATAPDDRASPHLYRSDRDLRQRLFALARDPGCVRAWAAAARPWAAEPADAYEPRRGAAPTVAGGAASSRPGGCDVEPRSGAVPHCAVAACGAPCPCAAVPSKRPRAAGAAVPAEDARAGGECSTTAGGDDAFVTGAERGRRGDGGHPRAPCTCADLQRVVARFDADALAPVFEALLYG